MINLIPPAAKTRIRTEYWVRAVALWLFVLAAAAVIFAVALLPAQVLITTESGYYQAQDAGDTGSTTEPVSAARLLTEANEEARLIVEQSKIPTFLPIADVVNAAAARDGVSIVGFEFTRTAGAIAPVRVSGVAPDRTSLAAFRDALVADARIEQVELPISNFAKNRDIEFSLSLILSTSNTGL